MRNIDFKKYERFSPLTLRISLGILFLFFGIDKLINPNSWIGWVPRWIWGVMDIDFFILSQGILEALIGALLVGGLFTRIVAAIASILMLLIIVSIGFNDIAIRDIGLLGASLSLILLGGGELSVDNSLRK